MSGRRLVVVVALVVALGTLPMTAAALGAVSPGAITVSDAVSDSPADTVTVTPGETVTVDIWANVTNVRGYQSTLTFDPTVVQVSSVSGSDDFDDPVTDIDNEGGKVAFNQLRSDETDDPVLAAITFTIASDASGSTALAFDESETELADSNGDTVGPDTFNGVELTVEDDSNTDDGNTDDSTDDGNTDDSTDDGDTDDSSGGGDTGDSGGGSYSGGSSGGGSYSSGSGSGGSSTESNSSSNETTVSLGSETGVSSTTADTGDPVEITLVLENTGENATNESFNVTAGGETIFETDVALSSGQERTIEFEHAFSDPGEYDIEVHSSALETELIDSLAVDAQSGIDTATPVSDGADSTANSVTETTGDSTTDNGTAPSDSGSGTSSLAGIGIGALLLFAMGAGLVIARRDGYGPALGGESTTETGSDGPASGMTPNGTDAGLSAVGDALADANIEVIELQAGKQKNTLAYTTEAANHNAARVEIRAIVRSYVSAADGSPEGKRLEATILEDDETLGTWHVRSEWLEQLGEGTLSMEALDEKVFGTVDRTS